MEEKREQTSILAKLRTNEKKLENDIQNKETDDSLKGKQIIQDELLNHNTYSLLSKNPKIPIKMISIGINIAKDPNNPLNTS